MGLTLDSLVLLAEVLLSLLALGFGLSSSLGVVLLTDCFTSRNLLCGRLCLSKKDLAPPLVKWERLDQILSPRREFNNY